MAQLLAVQTIPGHRVPLVKNWYRVGAISELNLEKIPAKIWEAIQRLPEHLAPLQRGKAIKLLLEFADRAACKDRPLGCKDLVTHTINTRDARPIKQPPRRVPLDYREQERAELQDMTDKDVVEKAS